MDTQNQIKRTLSQLSAIKCVRELLEGKEFAFRSELADLVCEHFGFYDPRGQKQRDGCVKALRELETDAWFILPVARRKTGPNSPKRLSEPMAAAEADAAGQRGSGSARGGAVLGS